VPVIGVYLRRLVVLFAIGALHVTLLWWGDVTWTYAVAGSGLLVFLRVSDRTRLVIAAILVFAPSLVMAIPGVRPAVTSVFLDPAQFRAELGRFGAAYRGASFTGIMPAHVRLALVWGAPLFAWYYPWILGRFLIGYVAGTQGWFVRDGADHLAMFRRMLRWGLILAAASTGFYVAVELGAFDGYTLTTAGRVGQAALAEAGLLALAATYMAAVVLWMQRPGARRWLRLIAPAGRMPLTTYIAQSAICTSLFYGWGLGWGGRIGAAGCLAIGFAIFALEVCACHLWLRRFRFGPLEWVWRTAVYLRPQPMRIARPEITTAPGPADS
jgi:uncharacterized protein